MLIAAGRGHEIVATRASLRVRPSVCFKLTDLVKQIGETCLFGSIMRISLLVLVLRSIYRIVLFVIISDLLRLRHPSLVITDVLDYGLLVILAIKKATKTVYEMILLTVWCWRHGRLVFRCGCRREVGFHFEVARAA